MGQTVAIHAGKRVVRKPGVVVEKELWAHLGEDWRKVIPVGAVLATATLAGMARVKHVNPTTGHADHDGSTEVECAVGLGQTRIDSWGDLGPGRWLWFLAEVRALPDPAPAIGHQSFWRWQRDSG